MAGLQDLREAITLGSGAGPLVQKIISPLLLEYVRKFAPLRVALPTQTWDTDIYFFNQRTALPQAQFVLEAPGTYTGTTGYVAPTTSTYQQLQFPIKHFQSNGDVSLFAQKVARVNGSLLDLEIEGAVRSMGWMEDLTHIFGSAAATIQSYRPAWDGFRQLTASQNKIDATQLGTNGVLTLPMLDSLIDAIRTPLAANPQDDSFFFVMSPKMQSRLVQLTTPITRLGLERRPFKPMNDGGAMGAPVTVDNSDPGVEVYSYRNIPIVLSSFLSTPGAMGAVSLSANATASTLPATTRYYRVTAVTVYGETLASAEVSMAPTLNQSIQLTWSTPTIIDPASGATLPVLYYCIWEGATTLTETLLAIVHAYTATAPETPVTSWIDSGAATSSTGGLQGTTPYWQGGANGDGYTYPNVSVAGNPNGYGSEQIYLVTRDPNFVVVPRVNDLTPQLLALVNARTRQFAVTADEVLAVRAGAFLSTLQRVRYA
jgi:hypothetical protein